MTDFFDEPRMPLGYGGARPNAGRKPKAPQNSDGSPTSYQRYETARAEKEEALARQASVKADIDEGKVVDRQAVADAAAKAFSKCSQALDAIGDVLERDGFEPALCERVMELINAAKAKLAADLEASHKLASQGIDPDSNDSFF